MTHDVPRIILDHLGGRHFLVMTGARNLVGSATSLTVSLPRTRHFVTDGITHVRVTLDPSDTYTVEFLKIRDLKVTEVAKDTDIYCEQLQDCFTRATGLATHL